MNKMIDLRLNQFKTNGYAEVVSTKTNVKLKKTNGNTAEITFEEKEANMLKDALNECHEWNMIKVSDTEFGTCWEVHVRMRYKNFGFIINKEDGIISNHPFYSNYNHRESKLAEKIIETIKKILSEHSDFRLRIITGELNFSIDDSVKERLIPLSQSVLL